MIDRESPKGNDVDQVFMVEQGWSIESGGRPSGYAAMSTIVSQA
jgi:hypothetical protein